MCFSSCIKSDQLQIQWVTEAGLVFSGWSETGLRVTVGPNEVVILVYWDCVHWLQSIEIYFYMCVFIPHESDFLIMFLIFRMLQ